MAAGCTCLCHHWARGNQRACSHAGRYMTAFDWAQRASIWEYHMADGVNTSDPMEAALACALCINLHTPALSGHPMRKYAPRIVKRFEPWVDEPSSDKDAT